MLYTILTILHVVVCTFLILVVLLQAGKGGGMGIAFGGGGSQTVFGSSGAGNFLTRTTAVCAAIFFLNSLALAYLSSQSDSKRLQAVAEKKAAVKKAEDAADKKILGDLEKARQQIETATGQKVEGPAGGTGGAPATGTGGAPAASPAPSASPGAPGAAPALEVKQTNPAGETSPPRPAAETPRPAAETPKPAAPTPP